jgi:hypothetical protein
MSLEIKLAKYVLALEECLATTHRAEDRALYERYLADAAGILASCTMKEATSAMVSRIESHERLWGTTWLRDDVYRKAAAAWAEFTEEVKRDA